MTDELIFSLASILNEWNPLGDKAATIDDLEGYKYEAMDILSTIEITKTSVENAVSQVLTQAFSITLSDSELKYYSTKITQLLRVQ